MKKYVFILFTCLTMTASSYGCDEINNKFGQHHQLIINSFNQHVKDLPPSLPKPLTLHIENIAFDEKECAFSEGLYKVHPDNIKTGACYFVKFHKTGSLQNFEDVLKDEELVKSTYENNAFSSLNLTLNMWSEFIPQTNQDPAYAFSVYPFVQGETFENILDNFLTTGDETTMVKGLFKRLGKGLGEFHQLLIVDPTAPMDQLQTRSLHNDLHDSNILISPQGDINLIDMGSAAEAIKSPIYLTKEIKTVYFQVTRFFLLLSDKYSDFFFSALVDFCKGYGETWASRNDVFPGLSGILKEAFEEFKPDIIENYNTDQTDEPQDLSFKNPEEWDTIIEKLCKAIEH